MSKEKPVVTREQWTAALRSGKYNQTQGRLYRASTQGFCCLGVLADLAGAEKKPSPDNLSYMIYDGDPISCFIHGDIAKMVNLSHAEERTVMKMNDIGSTFTEIADYLDRKKS